MKKKRMLLKTLIATISTIGLISATHVTASASYSFDVISDTHIGSAVSKDWHASSNLATTFTSIKKDIESGKYTNEQCIVIDGDVVDNSKDSSYNELSNIIKNAKDGLPYIYFNIGNHEYAYESNPYSVTPGDYKINLDKFNRNTNKIQKDFLNPKGKVTNSQRNNSYDFQYINNSNNKLIFLGTDEIPDNVCASNLTSNQLGALTSSIEANGDRNPMFIFSHQPVYGTTYGSDNYNWGYINPDNSAIIKNALIGNRKIIMFTGHTHEQFDINDGWNFNNFDSTHQIFSVPSIGEDRGNGPQGYHVTVYSGGIVVTGVKYTINGHEKLNTRTVDFE